MSDATAANQLSILIVDDQDPVREIICSLLEDDGHIVHEVADGFEALALLRAEKPVDLVLSDVDMPGIDGLALCSLINAEFPSLPVLLISGRPLPAGVAAFVPKPFRASVLTQAIARLASVSRTGQVAPQR